MKVITIDEMESGLSDYLYRASKGESFVVTEAGKILVEIKMNGQMATIGEMYEHAAPVPDTVALPKLSGCTMQPL
jgi:hypothetical protein